jgi:hypothetical protein
VGEVIVKCDGVVEGNGRDDGRCAPAIGDVDRVDGSRVVWNIIDVFKWDVVDDVWPDFWA